MPSITSDYARRVLFNPNGEGLDFTDTNNMQLFRQLHDFNMWISGAEANILGDVTGAGGTNAPDTHVAFNSIESYGDHVYAPWPGAAFWYASGVANQVISAPGPIVLTTDEPWNGVPEEFGVFRVPAGLTLTTAAGDATNPRIDLVEVGLVYIDGDPQTRHFEDATTLAPSSKSTNKERRVQFTYQIKQGTPAANPAYPTPTLGFEAMAAIYVPATHNAVHSPDNIRDLRMPLGVRAIDVDFRGMQRTGATPWVELSGAILTTQAGTLDTHHVIVPCPVSSRTARLLGVGIHGSPGDDAFADLVQLSYPLSNAAPTVTSLASLAIFDANGFTYADAMQISDAVAAKLAIRGTRVANRRVGTHLWCNGKAGGAAHLGNAPGGAAEVATKLALRFGCVGTGTSGPGGRASFVRFWVAGGL